MVSFTKSPNPPTSPTSNHSDSSVKSSTALQSSVSEPPLKTIPRFEAAQSKDCRTTPVESKLNASKITTELQALAKIKTEHENFIVTIIQKINLSRRAGTQDYKNDLIILKIMLGIEKFINKKYDVPTGIDWTYCDDNGLVFLARQSDRDNQNYILMLIKSLILASYPDSEGYTRAPTQLTHAWISQLNKHSTMLIEKYLNGMDKVTKELLLHRAGFNFGRNDSSDISAPFRFLHLCNFLDRTITDPNPNVLLLGPGTNSFSGQRVSYQPLEIMAALSNPKLTIVDNNPEIIEVIHNMAQQSNWYDCAVPLFKNLPNESTNRLDQYAIHLLDRLTHISGNDFAESITPVQQDLSTLFDSLSFENNSEMIEKIFPTKSYNAVVATKVLSYVFSAIANRITDEAEYSFTIRSLILKIIQSVKTNGFFIVDKTIDEIIVLRFIRFFQINNKNFSASREEITFPTDSEKAKLFMDLAQHSSRESLVAYRITHF